MSEMGDIIERLQGEHWWLNIDGNEAADEIKRLLEHLAHYRTLVDDLRAEIKQLRRALERRHE
jgi:hypothetical protein